MVGEGTEGRRMNFIVVFLSFLFGAVMGTLTADRPSLRVTTGLYLIGISIGVLAYTLLPDNRAGGCIRRGGADEGGAK